MSEVLPLSKGEEVLVWMFAFCWNVLYVSFLVMICMCVCEKIGEGEPEGMVFKGRRPIGLRYWECDPGEQRKNLITTRILRLHGLEEGVNRGGDHDTFARMVYLHGTNHEDRIGQPASAGCLQVTNEDALELFELVPVGTHLLIEKEGET